MRYYWETMDACVRPPVVLEAMRAAGFSEVKRTRVLGLFSEYSRRQGLIPFFPSPPASCPTPSSPASKS